MKKLFLMLLTCLALGADEITLDTKFISWDGKAASLYATPGLASHAGGLEPHWHQEVNITVHVKVSDLLGAEQMEPGARYRVDEISWVGHPDGWFIGGDRSVRLTNGREYVDLPGIDRQQDGNPGVRRKADAEGLSITRDDQLELILRWRNPAPGGIYMRYFTAADNARIAGTAMNLTPDGRLAGGIASENYYNKKWRYNSPAIRIKATRQEAGEPVSGILITLAEVGGFLLLLFLYLRSKRKRA
ncbi:MAG: hypothetical protein IKY92_00745 [Akkermansia sp.]|nr:hypothetical protein [Akkermansia sp.]